MQRLCVVMIITIVRLISLSSLLAQDMRSEVINPLQLAVACNKTSNLIFPYSVKSVDRGSADILAQKAKGVENILQIKAGKQGFAMTNLTVVTSDGKFYSFLVSYADSPSSLNLSFVNKEGFKNRDSLTEKDKAILTGMPVNEEACQKTAEEINKLKPLLHLKVKEQKMTLSLDGIWLKDGLMWFSLKVKNKSLVDYPVSSVRFFIRDRKRAKRTAVQEMEITPLYKNIPLVIGGKNSGRFVFAFTPFTISKSRQLIIQLSEQNGGRSLTIETSYRKLLKATRL